MSTYMKRADLMAMQLREMGYVVIPAERRVILTADYILPPPSEVMRIGRERMLDMIQRQQEQAFGRKLFEAGLTVSTLRFLSDPVTGSEQVSTTAVAVIKPHAE